MSSTVSSADLQPELTTEPRPLNASYGKLMMWFFIVSDALTFTGFLISYGFARFKHIDSWPIADEVFTHFPGLHGVDAPMYYVALMTFILIFSSVTMVLAVDAGHNNQKDRPMISQDTFKKMLTVQQYEELISSSSKNSRESVEQV